MGSAGLFLSLVALCVCSLMGSVCLLLRLIAFLCVQSDGERLPLAVKDLGSCDLYPQSLQHNPNGRFVTVCGDGEYIIYTALAWRNKSFGSALEFVWGNESNDFAIR